MKRNDIRALLIAISITAAMIWGLVYFIQNFWPILPSWLTLIMFILLAVAVIGYPIYILAQWSNRYLKRSKQANEQPTTKAKHQDEKHL